MTQPKLCKVGWREWWEYNNPKYWNFSRRKRAINWRDLDTPTQRAIRSVHLYWWELVLWNLGITRRLKSHDELHEVMSAERTRRPWWKRLVSGSRRQP